MAKGLSSWPVTVRLSVPKALGKPAIIRGMELYTTSDDSGLFNLLGKLLALSRSIDTARSDSVQTKLAALQGVLDLCPEADPVISAGSVNCVALPILRDRPLLYRGNLLAEADF